MPLRVVECDEIALYQKRMRGDLREGEFRLNRAEFDDDIETLATTGSQDFLQSPGRTGRLPRARVFTFLSDPKRLPRPLPADMDRLPHFQQLLSELRWRLQPHAASIPADQPSLQRRRIGIDVVAGLAPAPAPARGATTSFPSLYPRMLLVIAR